MSTYVSAPAILANITTHTARQLLTLKTYTVMIRDLPVVSPEFQKIIIRISLLKNILIKIEIARVRFRKISYSYRFPIASVVSFPTLQKLQ